MAIKTNNKMYRLLNPEAYLWTLAKARAKKKGWEFSITKYDIKIPPVCPILGIDIVVEVGLGQRYNAPSLDRIDSTKGYTKDNIRVISKRANSLKSDMTLEVAQRLVDYFKGTI